VTLHRSDLFAGLGKRTYDLIISNPPYVTAEAVAVFPPEYQAEPELAHLGGEDGMDLVRRILASAAVHLNTEGMLVVEVGMGRDTLETEYPDLPFLWLDTEQSEGEVFALPAASLRTVRP
jgi:ribosomal protein L3 glutamine methyltransferase